MKKYILGLIISLSFAYFALHPLTKSGFFSVHDDTQVGRVVAMGKALREGQFPVRWVSDLGYGYGYPIFNFYGPLPYYVGGSMYALGFSGLMATKIMYAVGIILAAFSMYALATPLIGVAGAVLASVLYTYAPYHAVQVYIRGSVGEYWAFAFLPIILLGGLKRNNLIIALGIFGVVTAHTIMGYVVIVGTLFVLPFSRSMIPGFLLGIGMSAFFWLPAFVEKSYTNIASQIGPTSFYLDHFVCARQLWDSAWGFAGSAAGCIDGMSYRLGKPHIALALLGLFLALKNRPFRFARLSVCIFIVSLVMMLPVSAPIWRIIPNLIYMQYPWRFLMFAVLGLSLLGASVIAYIRHPWVRWCAAFVCTIGVVGIYAKLFAPQFYTFRPAQSYETEEELRFRVSKISDEYLPPAIIRPVNADDIAHDTIKKTDDIGIKTVRETDTYGMFRLDVKNGKTVHLNKAYFPGWIYLVNSEKVTPILVQGLPDIRVPHGESTLEIRFTNTLVRTLGNTISLVCWLLFVLYYGKNKKTYS